MSFQHIVLSVAKENLSKTAGFSEMVPQLSTRRPPGLAWESYSIRTLHSEDAEQQVPIGVGL